MNKAYRIVWNAARQAWVVASERAGSGGRPPLAVKKAAGAILLLGAGMASQPVWAVVYTGDVISGAGVSQTLNIGDYSFSETVTSDAWQYISGGTAESTTVTDSGNQVIYAGGIAYDTTLSDRGSFQYVNSGAQALFTTVNNQATQYVSAGGYVDVTNLSNGGTLELNPNATAFEITVNSGGRAHIAGGSAGIITLSSGGALTVTVGGVATNITQLSGGALTADTSTTLYGTNSLGAFSVSAGQANNLVLENGGIFSVLSGGSATNTTVGSAGAAVVMSGGTASGTTVNSDGRQIIYSGGSATASILNGGQESVEGTATGTTVNLYGVQYVSAGGVATGTIINSTGTQDVYGTATATTVNSGGVQFVESGGNASATIVEGGNQFVVSGGTATDTVVNAYGQLNNYGSVTSATLNADGRMFLYGTGSTVSTQINSGGSEYINSGTSSTSATVNAGGYQTVYAGGSAVAATVSGGTQQVFGEATSTTLNSGGAQYVYSGGTATNTLIGSGAAQGISGTANSTTVAAGGAQYVYNNGSANWTTVTNNGYMNVMSGGAASGTTVNSGGTLYANDGAVVTDLTLASGAVLNTTTSATLAGTNALGAFSISGGQAQNVLLENNGFLNVEAGGTTTGTVINQGGWEYINGSATGTTVNSGGLQSVKVGGTTTSTVVNSGGEQDVEGTAISTTVNAGGTLSVFNGGIASSSVINDGGLLSVSSGGTATDTTVTSGGLLNIADGGVLTLANSSFVNDGVTTYDTSTSAALNAVITGNGQLTKNGTGALTLGGTFSQSQVNLNDGSLIMDGLQATTNIVAQSGTSLSLVNSTTLTGIIDPTDVNIDQSSSWNITGDSLVDTLTNAGSITFMTSQGAFTPYTLTVTNLIGNGGTITMYTVAGDSSSPTDKLVIDGGQATGSTGLLVLNRGGLGAQTTGNGITLIEAINGATTDVGAFTLNQPLVAGAYSYTLYRNADQSWYLTSQLTQTPDTDTDDSGSTPSTEVNYRDGMWSYAALPSLSLDFDRLVAGSADTRFHYAPDSRMWGRFAAGQSRHADSGSLAGGSVPQSSSAYTFLQLGGDLWQLDGANADWRAGIYAASGLMRSDVWRDRGRSAAGTDRDTAYTGGAYLSGRSHAGLRIDGLVQATHHSLSTDSNDGTRLSTNGTGWLATAEIGQAFSVGTDLSLEPQLQYTVQGLSLDDGQDGAASLNWSDSHRQSVRAGLKVGTSDDTKAKLGWWVTPSLTQTYGGHSRVTASVPDVADSAASFRSNLSGTGVGINGGVDAHIRQNVTLGVQAGWSDALHGGESGGYYGLVRLGVSFR